MVGCGEGLVGDDVGVKVGNTVGKAVGSAVGDCVGCGAIPLKSNSTYTSSALKVQPVFARFTVKVAIVMDPPSAGSSISGNILHSVHLYGTASAPPIILSKEHPPELGRRHLNKSIFVLPVDLICK